MTMLDTLIRGATVFDGHTEEPRRLAVGLRGEKIAYLGEDLTGAAAERKVDGSGLYLCPGFVDTHASTGLGYTLPRAADHKLFQGVTTEITGNCGTSSGPVGPKLVDTMERLAEEIGFTFEWRTLGDWLDRVESYGLPFNAGTFVGHATLRAGEVGDQQQVTSTEVEAMCTELDRALEQGGLGLSTGLVYAPGSFAETADRSLRWRGSRLATAASTSATSATSGKTSSTRSRRRSKSVVAPTCRSWSATSRPASARTGARSRE